MTNPRADRPTPDIDTESWWHAIADRTMTLHACAACGRNSLAIRPFCPHCWSANVSPVAASGRATLYTWTEVHQNAAPFDTRTPYVVAMVDLVEGPRLMTAIENCSVEALKAGLELSLQFRRDDDDFLVPIFEPTDR